MITLSGNHTRSKKNILHSWSCSPIIHLSDAIFFFTQSGNQTRKCSIITVLINYSNNYRKISFLTATKIFLAEGGEAVFTIQGDRDYLSVSHAVFNYLLIHLITRWHCSNTHYYTGQTALKSWHHTNDLLAGCSKSLF